MRHYRLSFFSVVCLAILTPRLGAQALVIWQPGIPGIDQSTELPPQNSKLVGYKGADVSDTDLAAMITGLKSMPKIMWVFGQCFGAGMFDELNGIANIQAGMSASLYNQTSNYPLAPNKGGNGFDFIWALVGFPPYAQFITGAVASPNLEAQRIFPKTALNDPWGPTTMPFPARIGETKGKETPVYFSKGNAAGALKLAPQTNTLAILWAGQPESDPGRDRDQIAQAIRDLFFLGYKGPQIFVLYGRGSLRAIAAAGKPVNPVITQMKVANVPLDHLYAGTKKSLQTVLNFKFKGMATDPGQMFFLAADHGINTAIAAGAPVPRNGDAGTPDDEDPADDPGSFAGQGDSGQPPAQ